MIKSALLCFALFVCLAIEFSAQAAPTNEHAVFPVECKIALRLISSPDYVHDHQGEIPDAEKMDEDAKIDFVAKLFKDTVGKSDDQPQFCTNTIRDNLHYTNAYHLPSQCSTFLPLLKKSFEEKAPYTKDMANSVQQKMNDSIIDMLILDDTAPDKLVTRCEVGIQVMQVDLNDKHLKEKYPLPVTCEVFFDEMERKLILPAQLETIKRQRVLFAIENKNTPEKLDEICEEITH